MGLMWKLSGQGYRHGKVTEKTGVGFRVRWSVKTGSVQIKSGCGVEEDLWSVVQQNGNRGLGRYRETWEGG